MLTRHQSVRLLDVWRFQRKTERPPSARPGRKGLVFQELWDSITFEKLQMTFESCRDWLRWIIEHDGEYFRKGHIYKSANSWRSYNRGMLSLLFGHPIPSMAIFWAHLAVSSPAFSQTCRFVSRLFSLSLLVMVPCNLQPQRPDCIVSEAPMSKSAFSCSCYAGIRVLFSEPARRGKNSALLHAPLRKLPFGLWGPPRGRGKHGSLHRICNWHSNPRRIPANHQGISGSKKAFPVPDHNSS
jgi:hypothetical protein